MRRHLIEPVALNDKDALRARGARRVRLLGRAARLDEIAAPTLVVVGEADRTFPLAWMEELGDAHPRRATGAHRRAPGTSATWSGRRSSIAPCSSSSACERMDDDLGALLSGPVGELGFGGVAGAIVGYTAKKVTKLVALALGLVFIAIQGLVYLNFVTVDWTRRAGHGRARVEGPAGRHPRRPCLGGHQRQPAVRRRLRRRASRSGSRSGDDDFARMHGVAETSC